MFVKAKREQVMKNDKENAAKETEKKNIAPVKTTPPPPLYARGLTHYLHVCRLFSYTNIPTQPMLFMKSPKECFHFRAL